MSVVRVGTRGSALALRQTAMVVEQLRALHPGDEYVVERIATKGDVLTEVPLSAMAGQGVFVDAIEAALREQRIDLAVHSAKDLPSRLDRALVLGAILERVDPRDVFVSHGTVLADLPAAARVGTSSRRRACQLRARRADIRLEEMRGNVDTRLRRLDEGRYDGIVLAAAGLQRLGLQHRVTESFDPLDMIPCPGQGAVAIEIRAGDDRIARRVAPLDHAGSAICVAAERAFLAELGAGCAAPVGAWARIQESGVVAIDAFVGAADGRMIRGSASAAASHSATVAAQLATTLLGRGADALLAEAVADEGATRA